MLLLVILTIRDDPESLFGKLQHIIFILIFSLFCHCFDGILLLLGFLLETIGVDELTEVERLK